MENTAFKDAYGLSDAQMKQKASFNQYDFVNVWTMCEGPGVVADHPHLLWENYQCAADLSVNIARDGARVVLSWTDPAGAAVLQSASEINGPWKVVEGSSSPFKRRSDGSTQILSFEEMTGGEFWAIQGLNSPRGKMPLLRS